MAEGWFIDCRNYGTRKGAHESLSDKQTTVGTRHGVTQVAMNTSNSPSGRELFPESVNNGPA